MISQTMTDLQVATAEDTLVQHQSLGDQAGFRKFNVGITAAHCQHSSMYILLPFSFSPFGLARELVQQNGNTVDGTTALEMSLDFLR